MALSLTFTSPSELLISPNFNGIYSSCNGFIQGGLSTNVPGGETIDSITVNQNTITIDNLSFDLLPASFPYTVSPLNPTIFGFDIYPSGTPGNTDTIEIIFNMSPSGSYSFLYDITELDAQNSITVANNTLPLDFGTVDVGLSSPVSFVVNNETIFRLSMGLSSDNSDMSFDTYSVNAFPRSTYTVDATWTPTSDYDLSPYKIFCDADCGSAIYDLAGISVSPPTPIGGYQKLIIANSISI